MFKIFVSIVPCRLSTMEWSVSAPLHRTLPYCLIPAPPISGSLPFTALSSMWLAVSLFFGELMLSACSKHCMWMCVLFPGTYFCTAVTKISHTSWFFHKSLTEMCMQSFCCFYPQRGEHSCSPWHLYIFILSSPIRGPSSLQLKEIKYICSEWHKVLHPVWQRQLVWLHQRRHCLCESQKHSLAFPCSLSHSHFCPTAFHNFDGHAVPIISLDFFFRLCWLLAPLPLHFTCRWPACLCRASSLLKQ